MNRHDFPYTDFHELNLDWFLNKFNELLAEWKAMQIRFNDIEEAFKALKDYVENFFDNLDVQQEINNKLDEMYESGQLQQIIAAYVFYFVVPQQFGAQGDGVTDDTAAVQAALSNENGYPVYFPEGVYAVHGLTCAVDFTMTGELKYNGAAHGTLLTITGNDKHYTINADLDNKTPNFGIRVEGSNNCFKDIHIKHHTYDGEQTNCSSIYVTGNYNVFQNIIGMDFTQLVTGVNDSLPQLFTTSGTATGNTINDIYAKNTQTVVEHYSRGILNVNNISAYECNDNGVYVGGGGECYVGHLYYDGNNEGAVVTSDNMEYLSSLIIDSVEVRNANAYGLRFANAKKFSVNDYFVNGNVTNVIGLSNYNTRMGDVYIGNIHGEANAAFLLFFPDDRGTIRELTIDNIDVTIEYDNSQGYSVSSFCNISACEEFSIGEINIKLINIYNGTFNLGLNTGSPTYTSKLGFIRFSAFQNDRVTRANNLLSYSTLTPNVVISNGRVTGGNTIVYSTGYSDGQENITASEAPTGLSARKGTFVLNHVSSVSNDVWGWYLLSGNIWRAISGTQV